MIVLVTGGAGYLGVMLVRRLLEGGHKVRCLDLMADDVPGFFSLTGLLNERYEAIVGDVRDSSLLGRAMEGVDAVVHLAAVVGYPACDADAHSAHSINVDGTKAVAGATPPGVPFVLASTCSVYGRATGRVCRESDPINPLTHYGRTKALSEEIVLDRSGVVLRPVTAYGFSPRFRWDLLVHTMLHESFEKRHVKLFDPDAVRPFVYVEDLARALWFAVDNYSAMSGKIFNVGSDESTLTKLELTQRIAGLTALNVELDASGSDPDGRNYRISFQRIEALGFRTNWRLSDGLVATLTKARSLWSAELLS